MLQIDEIAYTLPARSPARPPAKDRSSRITRLTADELPLIELFLLETDLKTRVSRFGGATSDASLVTYAQAMMRQARLLLGLFIDGKLCGMLEAHDCGERRMEVALLVESAFRRKGFGTSLLREAIAQSDCVDATRYQLIFAPDNWAMRRIAQKHNARLDLVLGEFCADIDLSRQ